MARLCARPGCSAAATATMTYSYAARTAWLDHLGDEPATEAYDLCNAHADRLGVPSGWTREDRRVGTRPLLTRVAV